MDEAEPAIDEPPPRPPRTVTMACEDLITTVFEVLLRRRPDAAALEAYAEVLANGSFPAAGFIREVAGSDEARARLLEQGAEAFAAIAPAVLREDGSTLPPKLERTKVESIVRDGLIGDDTLTAMMHFVLKRKTLGSIFLAEHESHP